MLSAITAGSECLVLCSDPVNGLKDVLGTSLLLLEKTSSWQSVALKMAFKTACFVPQAIHSIGQGICGACCAAMKWCQVI